MSSSADFVSAQRRLFNLFENGHTMTQEQELRCIDDLLGITRQMVRNRRTQHHNLVTVITNQGFRAITPPGSPSHGRAISPPREAERRYPPAELRPAAAPRTFPNMFAAEERRFTDHVRPSSLLREINTTLGRVALAQQGRNNISWGEYFSQCIKYRSIGKARFEANCTEPCAICLETHTNGETVVTEKCQHCFGKQCWENWISNPAGNQTCPTCREHRPKVIIYTMRRSRSNAMVDDNISEITQEN
jgi:hypothetical protein